MVSGWTLISVNYLATITISRNQQGLCHFESNLQIMTWGSIVELQVQPQAVSGPNFQPPGSVDKNRLGAKGEVMMKLKRYCLVIAMAVVLFLAMGLPTLAAEAGRYQALEINVGKKSEYNIFILDTKEGHMWLLETKESRVDGKLSGGLKYQGKLRPGNKAGEIIFEFGKTE